MADPAEEPVVHDAVPAEPVEVVASREGYLDAVERIRAGHGPIAVDAERASGFRYSQRAYLIQLFRRGSGTIMLDPPALAAVTDFAELADAMRGEEWVLHAASQDLPCLREVGLDPDRVFDTELAARLLGFERVGLGAVVEQLLGLHLAKEHSAADWSTRPLPRSWLVYAALDVELLVDVRDAEARLLDEAGKTAIAEQEFEAVRTRAVRAAPAEPWRRLSGVHAVRGARNLAVARELWLARDAYARDVDSAPGRLVPDASLVAVARTPPSSKRELAAMRSFSGRASRNEIDRWWAAVEAGLATEDLPAARVPSDTLPPPRAWADRNPEADRRLKAARPAIAELAEHLNLPTENLLTPDVLRRVAWEPPVEVDADAIAEVLRAQGAREWQIALTAPVIADAFVRGGQPDPASDADAS
ncbi:HRDC domain-containing protein [Amnibacterium sp. CER49]|uniref:HRDC domain-containing protein n=1 Tax=Amnibacterium sp. CER49 TaxID=3039161 RepID=UPI00244C820B|nr:HRDC domain-containing protein [Amnibacterium sp. CER49]MDH2444280.1 HRDC domain-containing protein [Amnibacterium sp. CER49]